MTKNEQKLKENLEYLRLGYILENYEETAKRAAREQKDHIWHLAENIAGDAACKRERGIERMLKNAKIPCIKTLEQFQWSHPEKVNRMQIENLFRLNFIENKENVIFLGSCGVGKSHLMAALAEQACRKGYSTLFTSAMDIINNLTAAKAMNNLEAALKKYISPRNLCIDEIGYLPIDKNGADMLFQVITKRYERGSIVLTSNRAFKDWAKIFNNDSTVTSAILDRLLHHSEVVIIEGKGFRMKEK